MPEQQAPQTSRKPLLINEPTYQGPERRTEMRDWRTHVDSRLDDGAAVMKHLRSELAENTIATKQVQADTGELVSLLNSFKGAFRALDMLGKLAKPLGYIAMAGSAIWGLFTVVKGGGQIK